MTTERKTQALLTLSVIQNDTALLFHNLGSVRIFLFLFIIFFYGSNEFLDRPNTFMYDKDSRTSKHIYPREWL